MKSQTIKGTLVAGVLILSSAASFAQHGPPPRPSTPPHGQPERGQLERDRTFDRDQDRDRMREQDRMHQPDFSQLGDDDIYGRELLGAEERDQYRRQLQNATSSEERRRIEEQHREMVQRRAEERGVQPAPPGKGIYGGAMMSVEERARYREQLRAFSSDEERRQFMSQHRQSMQQRARAQGVSPEDLEETEEDD